MTLASAPCFAVPSLSPAAGQDDQDIQTGALS